MINTNVAKPFGDEVVLRTAPDGLQTALIVSPYPSEDMPLREEFEKDGWLVRTCAGPGMCDCPVMRGKPCPLRESVDAAVVYVDPKELKGGSRMIPRLRCAADSASPGVIALEGRFDSPKYGRGTAIVGALRSPKMVLTAISALIRQDFGQARRRTPSAHF